MKRKVEGSWPRYFLTVLEGSNPVTVDKITTDADRRMGDEGFSTEMKEKQNISTKLFLDTLSI